MAAAQRYVTEQWRASGLVVTADEFSYKGRRFVNLIARPARTRPGARLIIGAHLDTIAGTPGADDNASGVAALLEVSRALARVSWQRPVEFIAFMLEESGMIGSTHYAERLRRLGASILGMLSLEMLGFTAPEGAQRTPGSRPRPLPSRGTFIGVVANARSRPLLSAVTHALQSVDGLPVESWLVPEQGATVPESRLSDHAPFWDRGFPALLVTDTAFFRNPHYHQLSDTVETLDLAFLERITRGVVTAVETLAVRR